MKKMPPIALLFCGALTIFPMLTPAFAQTSPAVPTPSDGDIRQILVQRIDVRKEGVGIVVGIVSPGGRRLIAYGGLAKNDPRPLNGDTVFEIGSVTKVFTSLVLMDMVQRGQVALEDPVAKYLPASVQVPERGGRQITLRDLSTQTSGLPRMPANFHPKDPRNPYADYTVEQLYAFLSGYTLTRDIGEQYEYSNLGVGLLGNALSRRAGMDYEEMVTTRILQPLGMMDTRVTLSPEMRSRLAIGHNAALRPVSNWDLPTLAGAGALRSTANDMLTFLAANLGFVASPLASAMAAEISVRTPTGTPHLEIAYGWHIFTAHGKAIYWHNGGSGGYRAFLGFDPAAQIGVVALSNASTPTGVDDIGHHLLDPAFPLAEFSPPREHKEITLTPEILAGFAGQYQLAPTFILTITQTDGHLYAQATGQGRFELFAEAPSEFFAKVTELTISFGPDAQGKALSLVLHQNGRNTPAKRIE